MNRYDKENCINQIIGYYTAPSVSDHTQSSVDSRFDSAKKSVIVALERNIENIKSLSVEAESAAVK